MPDFPKRLPIFLEKFEKLGKHFLFFNLTNFLPIICHFCIFAQEFPYFQHVAEVTNPGPPGPPASVYTQHRRSLAWAGTCFGAGPPKSQREEGRVKSVDPHDNTFAQFHPPPSPGPHMGDPGVETWALEVSDRCRLKHFCKAHCRDVLGSTQGVFFVPLKYIDCIFSRCTGLGSGCRFRFVWGAVFALPPALSPKSVQLISQVTVIWGTGGSACVTLLCDAMLGH